MDRNRYLILGIGLLLLGGCSGADLSGEPVQQAAVGSGDSSIANQDQLSQDLHSELMKQLEDLGVDPSRRSSQPPDGAGNTVPAAVFSGNPPDGAGSPAYLRLLFVPLIAGDYDGNGEVGIGDITPLAANFGRSISYDEQGVPQGDPFADGYSNWILSRVDGDGNGVITSSDITPIATHFGERADGWRIYYREGSEDEFSLLADPEGELQDYSIGWNDNRNSNLVQEFHAPWPAGGEAELFLQAWDADTDQAGPASAVYSFSADPQGCVAHLQLVSEEGDAPFRAIFNAVGSTVLADTYELEFGDGDSMQVDGLGSFPVEHFYQQGGIYTAQLKISCDGQEASTELQITVSPVPAELKASLFLFANEGFVPQTVELCYVGTDSGAEEYTIEFGDDSESVSAADWQDLPLHHDYDVPGAYPVDLTVRDKFGREDRMRQYVVVYEQPGVYVNLQREDIDVPGYKGPRFLFNGTSADTAVLDLGENLELIEVDLNLFDNLQLSSEQLELIRHTGVATLTIEQDGQNYSDSVLVHPATSQPSDPEILIYVSEVDDMGQELIQMAGVEFKMRAGKPWPEPLEFTTDFNGRIRLDPGEYDMVSHLQRDGHDSLSLELTNYSENFLGEDYELPQEGLEISLYNVLYGGLYYIKLKSL